MPREWGSVRAYWHRSGVRRALRHTALSVLATRLPRPAGVSHVLLHGTPEAQRDDFERLLDALLEYAPIVSVPEAIDRHERGEAEPAFALSFDDGCLTTATVAGPALARRGIAATVFVATGYLGLTGVALQRYMAEGLRWPTVIPPMTREHLRAWIEMGHEVGSHGVTHRPFSEITEQEARDELVESKRLLEEVTGRTIDLFAWPFGGLEHFPARYVRLAVQAGYSRLFSGVSRRRADRLPPHVMPRRQLDLAWGKRVNLYFALRG